MSGERMSSEERRLSGKRRAAIAGASTVVAGAGAILAWVYLPEGYFVLIMISVLLVGIALEALGVLR